MSLTATCHCGKTQLTIPEPPDHGTQCTCSFCTKRGALWGYYPIGAVTIVRNDADAVYSASGGINQHHFCAHCGCTTFSITPDWSLDGQGIPETRKMSVNLRLIDDFDLAAVRVETIDGRNLW
jgi:hypothetical protein